MLYEQIEAELRDLLGVEDVLLLPTLTHIHAAVIPVLADGGSVLLDARAHKTVYDGTVIARARGPPCNGSPTTTPRRSSSCCAGALRRPG